MNDLFNKKLMDFAEDVNKLRASGKADDVPQLDMLKPSISLAAQFDPKKPHIIFKEHVADKYSKYINERDEAFFLTHEYADDVDEKVGLNIVEMIKGIWKNLETEDKDAIWGHLQILLLLSKKC